MVSEPNRTTPATYAVGDFHGEVTLLARLLAKLPIQALDTIVFLGDHLDRGEDNAATIEALWELERRHPRLVFLRGNHEQAWLREWDGREFTGVPDIEGAQEAWAQFGWDPPAELGRWLSRTLVEYADSHAYYVHSGVLPGRPVWETPNQMNISGADGFLGSGYSWGRLIVCGHYELDEPLLAFDKACIDTGAWRSGVLTAVRLPGLALFQARR